ncbi:TPA: DUF3238 domain-containing protein [Bacillus cereus]
MTILDGSVNKRTGRASTEGVLCAGIALSSDEIKFQMRTSSSQPLNVQCRYLIRQVLVQILGEGETFPSEIYFMKLDNVIKC